MYKPCRNGGNHGIQHRHRRFAVISRTASVAGTRIGLFAASMNQNTENFEQLRRLLQLKRYEQPPPRYFNNFSGQVIARIKLAELGESNVPLMERILRLTSWLQQIWEAFQAKPALISGFGLVVCTLLVAGVFRPVGTGARPMTPTPDTASLGFNSEEIAAALAGHHPLLVKTAAHEPSSTDPIPAGPLSHLW